MRYDLCAVSVSMVLHWVLSRSWVFVVEFESIELSGPLVLVRSIHIFERCVCSVFFFFSSRRRHTRFDCDWSSDVCSPDLTMLGKIENPANEKLIDMNLRELATLVPLIIVAFWIGLYPAPFFRVLDKPVNNLVLKVRPDYFQGTQRLNAEIREPR